MGKFPELFYKIKMRERVLLIVAVFVLLFIGIDRAVITPFFTSIIETKERLETQKQLLKKYYSFIANKKQYETRLNDLERYYTEYQEKFLSEVTEELASAKLQEIINNLANKNGLVVSRSTALKKEIINKKPYLIVLSINFEISNLDSSLKLQNFLYDIEYNNEKLLFLDNLKIKTLGLNVVKGATISSTLMAIASIEKKS
ncbi:MAG: GspMb/PilO family protein [Candidatus Brocadiaceae bacterium]|nr:GspMb/PilO family protein [Candidatus Brocadiaceae bacterium]